ncbi:MAG: SMI1/KNR4 family protein [Lachnospiraceae bacterium]|nr:SMI1/KNR4 family protein [Lachnospiraceae bacterium]
MKRVEELKKLIEKVNTEKAGLIQLNPVIALEKVKAFEKKYKISLPKEYVEFITKIGDGGVIQSEIYGVQKLISLEKYELLDYPLEHIDLPFPLVHSWMPDWGDTVEGAEDEEDEAVIDQLMADRWEAIECQGNITIMADNTCNNTQWILVINGTRKGEIWEISEYGVFRLVKCGFLRWLELYLTDGLDNFMAECKKIEYPQEADLLERCKKFVKKERIIMNPPAGLDEIQAFERRHNISLPEEYIAFLSQIGNGAKKSPWYISEIYSLSDNESLMNMDQPFLIQTKEDYKKVFIDENGYSRSFGGRGRKTIWNCLFKRIDYENQETIYPWVLPQYQLLHGCMPIVGKGTPGDDQDIVRQYILILNGAYKGQVWRIDKETIQPIYNTEMPINALTVMEDIAYGGV